MPTCSYPGAFFLKHFFGVVEKRPGDPTINICFLRMPLSTSSLVAPTPQARNPPRLHFGKSFGQAWAGNFNFASPELFNDSFDHRTSQVSAMSLGTRNVL